MRAARVVLILFLVLAAAAAVGFAGIRLGYFPNIFASAPPRRLAPAGTLYTLTYSSFTVAGGVIGVEVGQKLKLVEDRGTTLIVDDGKYRGEIPVQNVTDDLDIAALASRRDAASQAQLQQALAAYRAEAARHESPFQPRKYYVPRPAPKP